MARPTNEELREKRIKRSDTEIQDKVVTAAPKAIDRLISIIEDDDASHAAYNSAAAKLLSEFRRYQEITFPTEETSKVESSKKDEIIEESPQEPEEDSFFIDLGLDDDAEVQRH